MRYLEDKKREKREFQRVIDEETRVRVETMKEDLAKRDYKLLDVEEKKTTNKQMMEKYDSYEEAEDDFMQQVFKQCVCVCVCVCVVIILFC